MNAPTQVHMEAAYRVLKYLKSCHGKGFLYKKHGDHRVVAFTDADQVASISNRQSILGYCTFIEENLVTW